MTFLPIVERELRAASRRRATYWSRGVSALVAILICAWMFLVSAQSSPVKELGKILFYVLSFVFMGSSVLAGIRFTADTLSEEKREGTLGLLFLTDLKGYDVVLGKLVASSVSAFYGLLAIFPVMAIPLLLGGVAPAEFWRMTVVLANTLFFSLATGLFVSSLSRSARKAMAGTFLLVVIVNALIPAAGAYLAYAYKSKQIDEAFLVPSVGYAYQLALDAAYRINPDQFLRSVLFTHGSAWILLLLASIAARYSWQDKPAGAATSRLLERWRRWVNGSAVQQKEFRTRLLDITPCCWLGGRHRLKPVVVWGVIGILAAVWLWGWGKWRQEWLSAPTYILTALLIHTTLKCWVASEACQKLGHDYRSGALELVLSTPLTVPDILRGQMLALQRQFLWPTGFIVLVDFIFMIAGMRMGSMSGDYYWVWLCLAGITVFVSDVYTLCWVGLWVGLTAKRANRATGIVIARVLWVPWVTWIAVLMLSSFVAVWNRIESSPGYLLGLWFLLSMVNDSVLYGWAHRRLHQDLRQMATQRFKSGRSRSWRFPFLRRESTPSFPPAATPQA